ncbi:MAG: LCP family protein [Lachnospiraceae bacterium]|nr:LCP family protein [Lachnospiraceae bacterium]
MILFVVEILILVIAVGVMYSIWKGTSGVTIVRLEDDDILVNEEVREKEETGSMKGYRNIALFGLDSRTKSIDQNTRGRSDTIMIASINQDTGDVKLVSVYRDTYLNLGNDSYNKCNTAYAKGGPEQAINMLNLNLDMNITDFVTVGFQGLIDTIDALGGVTINVQESEIVHLNNYQRSMWVDESDKGNASKLNNNIVEVTHAGSQNLSGLQATAYCRIRYVGNDFGRAERQRNVLAAVMEKVYTADASQLANLASSLVSNKEIVTSLTLEDITDMLQHATDYRISGSEGFPKQDALATGSIGSKGSCVVPLDLKDNVTWLHTFLFTDAEYTASSVVEECSSKIQSDTASYVGTK